MPRRHLASPTTSRSGRASSTKYDQARAPQWRQGVPPGQAYHSAGSTDDGVMVVALWDSEASWVTCRDETRFPGSATLRADRSARHANRQRHPTKNELLATRPLGSPLNSTVQAPIVPTATSCHHRPGSEILRVIIGGDSPRGPRRHG